MVDPEIIALDAALAAQGKTRAEVGRLLGLDSSQVSRIFAGKRRLQRHEHAKLTEWLGIAQTPAPPGVVIPLPGMIPLFGWGGAASDLSLALTDAHMRGYVPAHPHQSHVKDAFALDVADIVMSPRYEPGETVYMAPNRWPRAGQDCVVITRAGDGLLRRYLGRDEAGVRVAQLNPAAEQLIATAEVEAVHTVVGRG